MLLKMGGNENPSKEDVENLLKEVGAKVDDDSCDLFFKLMEGKVYEEVLAAGTSKLETACAGSGGGGGGGAAGGDEAGGAAAEEEEEEEEELVVMKQAERLPR